MFLCIWFIIIYTYSYILIFEVFHAQNTRKIKIPGWVAGELYCPIFTEHNQPKHMN